MDKGNNTGTNPLTLAAQEGQLEFVRFLVLEVLLLLLLLWEGV